MAVYNYSDYNIGQIISRWEDRALVVPVIAEGTNYPGRLAVQGTAVHQATVAPDATELLIGVGLQKNRYANRDIDTAYTAADPHELALYGSGCGFWGKIDANIAAVAFGSKCHASVGAVGFAELHVAGTHDTADLVMSLEVHAKDASDDIIGEFLL